MVLVVGFSLLLCFVVDDDKSLGLFLKHSQWPPKAFALPGLRANAASNLPWIPETALVVFYGYGMTGDEDTFPK